MAAPESNFSPQETPPKSSTESANVIYIKSKPRHVRDSEAHLRAFRKRYGFSQGKFGTEAGVSNYFRFESNYHKNLGRENIDKVVSAIGEIAEEDDSNAINAVTLLTTHNMSNAQRSNIQEFIDDAPFTGVIIFTRVPDQMKHAKLNHQQEKENEIALFSETEDKKWYKTINRVPFQDAVRILRISDNFVNKEYAEEIDMSPDGLTHIEGKPRKPRMHLVNNMIHSSMLSNEGKAAQLFRLKSQDKKPMALDELQQAPIGELLSYIRHTQGLTQAEVGKLIHRSDEVISAIEVGHKIPKGLAEDVISLWLNLDKDSVLGTVLRKKCSSQPLTPQIEDIQDVLNEKILFVESDQDNIRDSQISLSEQATITALQKEELFGDAIRFLRDKKNVSQTQLSKDIRIRKISNTVISFTETNVYLPKDTTIAAILSGLGYDLHDPVSHYVLRRISEEREKRKKEKS